MDDRECAVCGETDLWEGFFTDDGVNGLCQSCKDDLDEGVIVFEDGDFYANNE